MDEDDERGVRGNPVNDELPNLRMPAAQRFRWSNRALRWYFSPQCLHLDRAEAKRPTLFVGNHSVFGVLDVLLFADALYRERGISLRMLADRNHFKIPVWQNFVVQTGAVLGSRANCAALMRRGEHVLVFPGGAREVFKHKGEAYRLIWKERFGFVKLAVEHGYTITPYATVGAEEAFDVLLDSADYMKTPAGASPQIHRHCRQVPAWWRGVSAAGAGPRADDDPETREAVFLAGHAHRDFPLPGTVR